MANGGTTPTALAGVAESLALLYPWSVAHDEKLARALAFLDAEPSASVVRRAGYGVALVVGVLGACALWVVPGQWTGPAGIATVVAAAGAGWGLPRVVTTVATAKRTAALGAVPGLVSRAVLRMHLEPSPEAAVAFATDTGTGPLTASLREHAHRASLTAESGLASFGREWSEWFPALERATELLVTAGNVPNHERERTLARALSAVLDGTQDATADFATRASGPATALYAFGVLVPLALVALLPAASAAGLGVSRPVLVVGYDVALPLLVGGTGAWLLANRPAGFPASPVPRSHPDIPDGPVRSILAGVGAGVAAVAVASVVFAPWTVPLAAAGAVPGATLVVRYRSAMVVRREVRRLEAALPDALAVVGRRVEHGAAVETAIARTGEQRTGPVAALFAAATGRQRRLGAGVREAFLGDLLADRSDERGGALATVPSTRVRSVAELLALTAREGQPAGTALVAMADHLEELRRIEREMRRQLQQVTRTLANTAAVFAPLVGGATVALADAIGSVEFGTGGAVPATPTLGLAVGAYVLLLSALLAGIAAGLERGFDRTLVGYRVGGALCSATVVYLSTTHAVGLFV